MARCRSTSLAAFSLDQAHLQFETHIVLDDLERLDLGRSR